jgi:hypothetical protein
LSPSVYGLPRSAIRDGVLGRKDIIDSENAKLAAL